MTAAEQEQRERELDAHVVAIAKSIGGFGTEPERRAYIQGCTDGRAQVAAQQAEALAQLRAKVPPERFPIMDGPSVLWSVIAPHEHQAIENHGQDLRKLASRGGLGSLEAWAVVNGWNLRRGMAAGDNECRDEWRKFVAASEQAEVLASEVARLVDEETEFTRAWYATRFERLREFADKLPEAERHAFYSICANGTADVREPPTYAQMLNRMKHRVERAEAELAALRKDQSHG